MTKGTLTMVAGNSFSGDGGLATNAAIGTAYGVSLDTIGNIYISSGNQGVVRKVFTNGTITTVAEKNHFEYSGDGGPATSAELVYPTYVAFDTPGNMYIADSGNKVARIVYNCSAMIEHQPLTDLKIKTKEERKEKSLVSVSDFQQLLELEAYNNDLKYSSVGNKHFEVLYLYCEKESK